MKYIGHLTFVLFIFVLPSSVFSQSLVCPDASKDVDQNKIEARRYFELGMTFFNVNKFDKSAEAFECVIKLVPYTVTARFRLALSYDKLGKVKLAKENYQWVMVAPSKEAEPLKAQVKKRLEEFRKQDEEKAVMEKAEADRKKNEEALRRSQEALQVKTESGKRSPTAAGTSADAPTPKLTSRWWFWTGIGVTVICAGTAVVAGLAAIQEKKEYEKSTLGYADFKSRYDKYLLIGDFAVGGALFSAAALGAAIWFVRPDGNISDSKTGLFLVPFCDSEGCVVTMSYSF